MSARDLARSKSDAVPAVSVKKPDDKGNIEFMRRMNEVDRCVDYVKETIKDLSPTADKAEQDGRIKNVLRIKEIQGKANDMFTKAKMGQRGGLTGSDKYRLLLDDKTYQIEGLSEQLANIARDNVITNTMSAGQLEQVRHAALKVNGNMKIAYQAARGEVDDEEWDVQNPLQFRVKEAIETLELLHGFSKEDFAKLSADEKREIEALVGAVPTRKLQQIASKVKAALLSPDSSPDSKFVADENAAPHKKRDRFVPASKCLSDAFDGVADERRADHILRPASQKLRYAASASSSPN